MVSQGSGIVETTTIDITEGAVESVGSSAMSSATPKEWEEVLQAKIESALSESTDLIVEQGRVVKVGRHVC